MFGEEKNIKDIEQDSANNLSIAIKDSSIVIPFTKTNKLITALYMVTDILDKDEPIRSKLRTLGAEIISDIHTQPSNVSNKISQVMSFLEIASAINIISSMNCSILKKEFLELRLSIQEHAETKPSWLEEFLFEPKSIGHNQSLKEIETKTRIGVQKGSTLMKALSKVRMSGGPIGMSDKAGKTKESKENFEMIKKERRYDIVAIIKKLNSGSFAMNGATITDIKTEAQKNRGTLSDTSEKTLQRELVAMVADGVLYKTGSKRWSRYFIK